MTRVTTVSSPGKVLVAGGYLVLDPAYSGVVVSTSSRFYTVVQDAASGAGRIVVRSPQFRNAIWNYGVNLEPDVLIDLFFSASKNKFVELALQKTVALACEAKGKPAIHSALSAGLEIAIVGDNDFYSQRAKLASLNLPRTFSSLSSIQPLSPTGVQLSEVHKTGLGSSAALITSLVFALLIHLNVIPESSLSDTNTPERHLAHNLAQYIHCLAQGKIGSGFDVSAAVFGSHLYTRFAPAALQDLMGNTASSAPILSVLSPSNPSWNYSVKPFQLPPLTRIVLADVDAGSDTPSLVGKVLKWRSEDSEKAHALWTALDQLNQSLANTLLHLSTLYQENPKVYTGAVKYLASLQTTQWRANPDLIQGEEPIMGAFYEAHRTCDDIRSHMRDMGDYADVPIEPPEQADLLDACTSLPGVIGGGVPGAGGYDAIWLLICDPVDSTPDQPPIQRVEHLWSNYSKLDVSPLSATESHVKGSRVETLADVPGLLASLSA